MHWLTNKQILSMTELNQKQKR